MDTYRGRDVGAPRQWKKRRYCCHGTCSSNTRDFDPEVKILPFPKPCSIYITTLYDNSVKHDVNKCTQCSKAKRWLQLCTRADNRFQQLWDIGPKTYICNKHFVDSSGPTEMHPDPFPADKDILKVMAELTMPDIKKEDIKEEDTLDDWSPVSYVLNQAPSVGPLGADVNPKTELFLDDYDNQFACHQDPIEDPLELPASDPFETETDWRIKTEEVDISDMEFPDESDMSADTLLLPHPSMAVLGNDTGSLDSKDRLVYSEDETTISQSSDSVHSVRKEFTSVNRHSHFFKFDADRTCDKKVPAPDFKTSKMSKRKAKEIYTCCFCGEEFSGARLLKKHERSHSSLKTYECDTCSKHFTRKHHLVNHMLSHSGIKAFACTICNKRFVRNDSLRKHMAIHMVSKPYACTICDKKFGIESSLRVHMTLHTDLKPYECEICDKKFSRKINLKQHGEIHSESKPYACTICDKKFRSKGYSIRHVAIHSGLKPFSCTICDQQFGRLSDLKRHSTIHTNLKPYECEICAKKFRQKGNLKQHKAIHK